MTDKEICDLYKSGLSIRQTAIKYNTNEHVIKKILRESGIQMRPRAEAIKLRSLSNDRPPMRISSFFKK